MKNILSITIIAILAFSGCANIKSAQMKDGKKYGTTSGTFRDKWWNYYERGLSFSEGDFHDDAVRDFQDAIEKREKDQWRSRTYGMHFVDYFPHRELGIVYYNQKRYTDAAVELEKSLSTAESSKSKYYLNKVRREILDQNKKDTLSPKLNMIFPEDGFVTNTFSILLKGMAEDDYYVSSFSVNDAVYPLELSSRTAAFEKEVQIDQGLNTFTVQAADLTGKTVEKTLQVICDRDGPVISIFDIVKEQNGSGEIIRITGEINDSTGIVSVILNDKAIDAGGMTSYEFNMTSDKMILVLRAYDRLNNVTSAQIDIEKELAAFHEKQAPVLLAFNGTGMFSSDDAPPVIVLKESADMPRVFVDKYYVEGEVSDNSRVERVIVNGRDILSKKGKKIFFSKLVKLDEGKNRIEIEAFDSSGNRSGEDFIVTRNIPEALQIGNRMSISILPFNITGEETAGETLAYDHLTSSFVSQRRFNVIEREKLEQVLLEQKLTREKLTDSTYSIKVGRLIASDAIIATSAAIDRKSVEFTSTVINIETSEIMDMRDVYSEDRSPDSIKQMMDNLASKVAGGFPLVEGHIISREKGFVYTDIGAGSGIKGNMGIIVYRKGQEIKHPLTGKSLGQDMKNLGTARLQEINDKFSKARLSDTPGSSDIKALDMVITR